MKKINWGKKFENDFKDSSKKLTNIIVQKIPDQLSLRRNSKNISDFYCYVFPNLLYIELKSTQTDTLPLSRVSDYQYQKLIEMSKINGVKCGVLIQFREFNEVWYINISKMEEMRLEGKKTIKIDEARNIGLKLDGTIKKVNWKYNLEKFFQEVL